MRDDRDVGELDKRARHFYIAMYWAGALTKENQDPELKARFAVLAKYLAQTAKIIDELNAVIHLESTSLSPFKELEPESAEITTPMPDRAEASNRHSGGLFNPTVLTPYLLPSHDYFNSLSRCSLQRYAWRSDRCM